jgi:enoyl-CoA hydratase/carnithine racemase
VSSLQYSPPAAGIALLRLDRPARRDALDPGLLSEPLEVFRRKGPGLPQGPPP